MTKPFPCTQCGACCRHVNLSPLTAYLDRGDGMCKHYNQISQLCNIYTDRPEICQINVYYEKHYKHSLLWDEFVNLNLIACKQLNDMENSVVSINPPNTGSF